MIARKFKGRLQTDMEVEELELRQRDKHIIKRLEEIRQFQQAILERREYRSQMRDEGLFESQHNMPPFSRNS